jgi:hypothetical protein
MMEMSDKQISNSVDASKTVKNTRRSFLKKTAIGAPVVSSIASQPVWGAGICALSGSLSGNLSNHGDQSDCKGPMGRSPGYWAQWEKATSCNTNHWPQGDNRIYNWSLTGYLPLASFSLIFGASPISAHSDTLGAVMRVGGGTDSFERHVVAAFLSANHPAMSALVPYTAQQVKDAFAIVNANPGTQQAADIIAIFNALFANHDENPLSATPTNYDLSGYSRDDYRAIIGAVC